MQRTDPLRVRLLIGKVWDAILWVGMSLRLWIPYHSGYVTGWHQKSDGMVYVMLWEGIIVGCHGWHAAGGVVLG